MKNTVLNFNSFESINYLGDANTLIIKDITESYYKVPEKYYNEKYYDNVLVEDDERLDLLAYKYYGEVNKWDLIMVYNDMESPFLLPKNYDFVIERGSLRYDEWYRTYGEGKPYWFLEAKQKYFQQVSSSENERYRNIKLIKKSYITDVMKEIDDGFRVK